MDVTYTAVESTAYTVESDRGAGRIETPAETAAPRFGNFDGNEAGREFAGSVITFKGIFNRGALAFLANTHKREESHKLQSHS